MEKQEEHSEKEGKKLQKADEKLSLSQLSAASKSLGLKLTDEELASYLPLVERSLVPVQTIEKTKLKTTELKFPRDEGRIPSAKENPHNAIARLVKVEGSGEGKLKGKKIALKDSIFLAGVPLKNGTRVLGFKPEYDATIVNRILEAGGTITAKCECEELCMDGGSYSSSSGKVYNPRTTKDFSAGGSSSGCAAILVAKEHRDMVDMAIGGDQGGSIRIPSCLCGVVGLKPTWGLVPYTGALNLGENTIDNLGPMARNVRDNALLLEVLAGDDGLDLRQKIPSNVKFNYTQDLEKGIKGLKIGFLKEGFAENNPDIPTEDVEPVLKKVREMKGVLEKLGATVEETSNPIHSVSYQLWTGMFYQGLWLNVIQGGALSTGSIGVLSHALASSDWVDRLDEFGPSVKVFLLTRAVMSDKLAKETYAKAKALQVEVTQSYDALFKKYDLLVLPTVPHLAERMPNLSDPADILAAAHTNAQNTAAFSTTGHPSLNLPIGKEKDGRPIGMMIVGRKWEESTIYRCAFAVEKEIGTI